MTPKEKAQELVDKFLNANGGHFYQDSEIEDLEAAKECALVAVDEMIDFLTTSDWGIEMYLCSEYLQRWREIKKELEKM